MNRRAILCVAAALALAACSHYRTDAELGIDAFQQGYGALQRQDYDKAELAFTEAARLMPDDAYTQLDLGVTEQHLGKFDAARTAYRRAVDLGRTLAPRDVSNPLYGARTVGQLAADDLAGMAVGAPPPPSGSAPQH